jgi:hypothetical protein
MNKLISTLANKFNTLLIDSITSRNILNNPYNAFHPIFFSSNLENKKLGVPYLLCVVMPFLHRLKDFRRLVHQFQALNDRVVWKCLLLGDAKLMEYDEVGSINRHNMQASKVALPWIVKRI